MIVLQDTAAWEDVELQNSQILDKPVRINEVQPQGKDVTEQASCIHYRNFAMLLVKQYCPGTGQPQDIS
jgi:hypothetical protein